MPDFSAIDNLSLLKGTLAKSQQHVDTVYVNDSQTITLKTIDSSSNTFIGVHRSVAVKVWGWQKAVHNAGGSYGIMGGCGVTGTATASMDATEGNIISYSTGTTANSRAGVNAGTTNIAVFRMAFNTRARFRFKIDSTTTGRAYVGFTSATTVPNSDTPLATTDLGVLVGFRTTDTNWSIFNNDGSAAMVVTSLGIAKDANYHSVTIIFDNTTPKVSVTFDGGTATVLTTRIPAATTNLVITSQGQNSSTTARSFTPVYTDVESDV